jgi:hypothetical protein
MFTGRCYLYILYSYMVKYNNTCIANFDMHFIFRFLKTNPTMKIITAIDQKGHGLIQL